MKALALAVMKALAHAVMKTVVLALLLASPLAGLAFAQAPRVSAEDLRVLTGGRWKGTLTYTDYGSGRQVSIPSDLTVTRAPGDETSWVFEYEYPKEPKANGRRAVRLEEGGALFDGARVIERTSLGGGALKVVTERRGKDDDREALFRHTYTLAGSSFSISKEVRREGAAEFFERNRYSWQR